MQDYKGIYHNTKSTTNYYEFGAHFKYLELYNALTKLKREKIDEIPLEEESKLNNNEEIEPLKKRKKYKLKTIDIKESKRYLGLITDINEKEISSLKGEQDNNNINKSYKRNELLTKSLNKVPLPKINIKNINNDKTLKDKILSPIKLLEEKKESNDYRLQKLSKSLNFKKKSISEKKEKFPKINSVHNKDNFQENMGNKYIIEETQSKFQDNNESIKIFNNNIKNRNIFKKFTTIGNERIINEQEKYLELLPKPSIKLDKLKSIFDKEKEIKKSNLFLGQKNNYSNNNRNLMKDEMAQQIHNLKMQILSNPKGK